MNGRAVAGGVFALALTGLALWLMVPPEEPEPAPLVRKRLAVKPAPPVQHTLPAPAHQEQVEPEEVHPHADNEPMFTEAELIERAAVDARLALPPEIEVRFGSWDGSQPTPARMAAIEDLLDRAITEDETAAFKELFVDSQEDAALAVGRFRQGLKTEAEAVGALDAAEQTFRDDIQSLLGLSEAQYHEVFGLGTAE